LVCGLEKIPVCIEILRNKDDTNVAKQQKREYDTRLHQSGTFISES